MSMQQVRFRIVLLAMMVLTISWTPLRAGVLSVGGYGGKVWTLDHHAANGNDSDLTRTRFGNSETFGGYVGYLWELDARMFAGFELNGQSFKLDYSDGGVPYGKIKATPLFLQAKVQTLPKGLRGIGSHLFLGGGVLFSDFETGPNYYNGATSATVETDESFALNIGGGLDYFFTPRLALATHLQFLWSSVGCNWQSGGTVGIDRLNISNVQLLIGLQAYF